MHAVCGESSAWLCICSDCLGAIKKLCKADLSRVPSPWEVCGLFTVTDWHLPVLFLFLSGFGKQRSPKRCLHCCTHHKNRWELLHCFFIPQSTTRLLNLLGFRSTAVMTVDVSRCVCVRACVQGGWELARRRISAACSTGGRSAVPSSASPIFSLLTPRMTTCSRFTRKLPRAVSHDWISSAIHTSGALCCTQSMVQLSLHVSRPEGKTRQWCNSSLT